MPIGREPIEKGNVVGRMENAGRTSATNLVRKESEKNKKFEIVYSEPRYGFEDIVLSRDTLSEIEDAISVFQYKDLLFDEWNLSRVMKKNGSCFINLYGAPGTGKTMTANAIAKKMGKKLLWVNYADIESKFVGETSKNIVYLFEKAAADSVVILFDEADALLSKRVTDMSSATDVSVNQTRSVLLYLLDNYEGIIIFTTNFIRNYDPAFMRRIPYHIKFDLPNEEFRIKLLQHYLTNTVPNHIVFDDVAKKYEGIVGSDISNAVMMASIKAAREGLKELRQEYLEDALERIIQSKNDNHSSFVNVRVYEREVSEEYALNQIKKTRGANQ